MWPFWYKSALIVVSLGENQICPTYTRIGIKSCSFPTCLFSNTIHFLHPRAKLTCIVRTWVSRSQCIVALGRCTKKRQPGQRERTRHDRKMQSDRADEKKLFALLDRLTCPCRTPCSTNHGSSKSMIGFMIGIAIS